MARRKEDLVEWVLDRALAAFAEVGVPARRKEDPEAQDASESVLDVDGQLMFVEVKASVGAHNVASLIEMAHRSGLPLLVAAERITQAAKGALRAAGVGFYDGQGHLRLFTPRVRIDAQVAPAFSGFGALTPALAGEAAKEAAIVLLGQARTGLGVRELARVIDRAPSTVSAVLDRLRSDGLITSRNEPVVPDLFWELAGFWRHTAVPLADLPRPGQAGRTDRLHLGFGYRSGGREWQLDPAGWALTDTVAAAAWGMPVVADSTYPPDFFVPSTLVLDRAVSTFGRAASTNERACTVTVTPARLVCTDRTHLNSTEWPAASWVVVALDLARDRSRGREILERWSPPGVERVW
ncbi:MAG: transcriptional regulator [Acidimicrobiales bacterium]